MSRRMNLLNYYRIVESTLNRLAYPLDSNSESFMLREKDAKRIEDKVWFAIQVATLEQAGWIITEPTESGAAKIYTLVAPKYSYFGTNTTIKDSLRLPTEANLSTLPPKDFFTFFTLLATSTPQSNGTSFALSQKPSLILENYFTMAQTYFHLNADLASEDWTSKKIIKKIAALAPTLENQLSAIQYLLLIHHHAAAIPIDAALLLADEGEVRGALDDTMAVLVN